MKTAQEIYTAYEIMPGLQLHQLRVASVAKLMCENLNKPINIHDVTLACLFHDMGNIIKSDLTRFPEFLEPQGFAYWERVRAKFIEKYGDNAHHGNVAIAKEIGLNPSVIELIDGISFSNIEWIVANASFEQKISEYADDRVGPFGILSVADRLADARARYIDSGKTYYTLEGFEKLSKSVFVLEKQIFAETRIAPEDITDDAIAPLIEELRQYGVA